jgi:AmmeMemoRadiSam system protein B
MATEQLPDHIRIPHLRPIQPILVQKDGRPLVALRDPAMLVNQTMMVSPQVMRVLQHFNGERDLASISTGVGVPRPQLEELASGLDRMGLLWGPTFESYEKKLKARVEQAGAIPAGAAIALGASREAAIARLDEWLSQVEDAELGADVSGVIAPHLDYERGWPNYAAAYKAVQTIDRPDRVVILGTNHFGIGDGVVVTQYGFDSPLGRSPADSGLVTRLTEALGPGLTIDQLDHVAEHSIQLHVPWIQRRWGDVPVLAALVPDPLSPMLKDDGARVPVQDFANALGEALDAMGGRTFFVASADLSHVGPQFGEPRPVDQQRRNDVELHDRDLMGKYLTADPEEFLGAMKWCNNPTRWCSVGNMVATLMALKPETVELIDYRQACDDQGLCLVSSAAMGLIGGSNGAS